jgi:hypothetical protein
MATSTTSVTMTCPRCGCAEAGIVVNTNDLTTVECYECNETFTPAEAAEELRAAAAKWERFAKWLEMIETV